MEHYRKDLGMLVIVCVNVNCKEIMTVDPMIESCIKAGQYFKCHKCDHRTLITQKLEDYVKQTRCYQ